jgi:phosphate transport system substrate-binding protein
MRITYSSILIMHLHDNLMYKFRLNPSLVIGFVVASIVLSSALIILPETMSVKVHAQNQITLNGAGATFPFPLIDTWRVEYQKIKPNVNINYQSIGSGGGVKQFTEKTVDFGASDAPLTRSEQQKAPGAVHIPETIGSVVVAYNLPTSVPNKGLKLTGPIVADIFLGKIKKWNDPQIQSINPGITLPSDDIVVVHRSDGSGTTFVWTSYLSKISPQWNQTVGSAKSVQWPIGIGAPGNEGVANAIKGTPNTIGYVELAYALTTKMPYAFLQNKAGKFIEPTLDSTRAAAASASRSLPAGDKSWESVSLLNEPGENSYPIASYSYLLLYKELSTNPNINSQEKAKALADFISWALTDGQKFASILSYVPLPDEVVKLDQDTLKSLTFKGQPVFMGTANK